MKLRTRIFSMMLALLMLAMSSCGVVERIDTSSDPASENLSENDAREESDMETPTVESNTEKEELDEVVDTQGAEESPVEIELLTLDFDTELSVAEYLSSLGGIKINERLNGGEIADGK